MCAGVWRERRRCRTTVVDLRDAGLIAINAIQRGHFQFAIPSSDGHAIPIQTNEVNTSGVPRQSYAEGPVQNRPFTETMEIHAYFDMP